MRKPAAGILGRERLQTTSNRLLQGVVRARSHAPQERFQLGEGLFDGRQVGGGGREPEDLALLLGDGLAHPLARGGTHVIEHHHLPGLQAWSQHLFHVGFKRQRVHRSLQDEGCLHPLKRESGNQGRMLASVAGHGPIGPLPTRRAGLERGEGNVGATFVNKDQALDWEGRGQAAPGCAGCFAPLGGTHLFFWRGQPKREIARLMLAVLTSTPGESAHHWQCCSSVASSWAANCVGSSASRAAPYFGWAAWNRFGSKLARLAALAQIPFDRRQRDLEHLHNLLAWGAVIDGVEDTLAKIG